MGNPWTSIKTKHMGSSILKQAKLMGYADKSSLSLTLIFMRVNVETIRRGTGTEGKFMSTETTMLAIGKIT